MSKCVFEVWGLKRLKHTPSLVLSLFYLLLQHVSLLYLLPSSSGFWFAFRPQTVAVNTGRKGRA